MAQYFYIDENPEAKILSGKPVIITLHKIISLLTILAILLAQISFSYNIFPYFDQPNRPLGLAFWKLETYSVGHESFFKIVA